jgi:hypothetical protein
VVPTSWPDWWGWELELTSHLERRMEERDLTELDLREVLEAATGFSPNIEVGRFVVFGSLRRRRWNVIVEPDFEDHLLVVVTAFFVE